MKFSLLIFTIVSACTMQVPPSCFSDPDSPESQAKFFLDRMLQTIKSPSIKFIKLYFGRSFIFRGCKRDYSLDDVVDYIEEYSPSDMNKFSYKITSSSSDLHYLYFDATLTGFGVDPLNVRFVVHTLVLNAYQHTLSKAREINCSEILETRDAPLNSYLTYNL